MNNEIVNEKVFGLVCSVYRKSNKIDCSNRGNSSKTDLVVITGDGVDCEVFEASGDSPHYIIIKDMCAGCERIRAIPKELVDSDRWTMFGGNFLYTSDSRFPSNAPIAIHDRVEPWSK